MADPRLALAAILLFAFTAPPALAHKLMLFAAANGSRIEGSAYFPGGGNAAGVNIVITDADGALLAELKTGADGRFSYVAQAAVEHRITAETLDGHRVRWTLAADELAGGFPVSQTAIGRTEAPLPPAIEQGSQLSDSTRQPPTTPCPMITPAIQSAFENAVARQIAPLREELLKTQQALRLQDILGGIGYIFGLMGITLWWRCRRPRNR